MENKNATSSGRWWEFYLVRYLIGTVFGTFIVTFLTYNSNSKLSKKLYTLVPYNFDINNIQISHIIVLGAIGFAYCYFASAPILVLHAFRSTIFQDTIATGKKVTIGLIITVILFGGIVSFLQFKTTLLWLLIPLLPLILIVMDCKFEKVYSFYNLLCNNRARNNSLSNNNPIYNAGNNIILNGSSVNTPPISNSGNTSSNSSSGNNNPVNNNTCNDDFNKEFIESYKHLREHGNAFMILLMEFILGISLYYIENPIILVVFIILWILPASFVWFLGSYLEKKFTE